MWSSKNVCFFNMNQANVYSMFTVNNKDNRTTPLTSLISNIVNTDNFNVKQLSHLILVLKLLTLNK